MLWWCNHKHNRYSGVFGKCDCWCLADSKQFVCLEVQLCLCVRCTKIINADSEDPKYIINVKQFAKFVVDLSDQVAPTDIEEGMRVGYAKSLCSSESFCSLFSALISSFCSGWNHTTAVLLLDDSNSPVCSAGIMFWFYVDKNWQTHVSLDRNLAVWAPTVPAFRETVSAPSSALWGYTQGSQEMFTEDVKPVTLRVSILAVCHVGYFEN